MTQETAQPWFSIEPNYSPSQAPRPVAFVQGPEIRFADKSQGFKPEHARLMAAAPDMLAALVKIDAYWTLDFPGGPDGDRSWAGGLGKLSDDTIEIWRAIRAAIAKASPVHPPVDL